MPKSAFHSRRSSKIEASVVHKSYTKAITNGDHMHAQSSCMSKVLPTAQIAKNQQQFYTLADTQNHTQNILQVLHNSRCSRASRSFAKTGFFSEAVFGVFRGLFSFIFLKVFLTPLSSIFGPSRLPKWLPNAPRIVPKSIKKATKNQ